MEIGSLVTASVLLSAPGGERFSGGGDRVESGVIPNRAVFGVLYGRSLMVKALGLCPSQDLISPRLGVRVPPSVPLLQERLELEMGSHSHKKGVLSGSKMNARHSTYIPSAESLILAAKARQEVTKIVLGPIVVSGGGRVRTKYKTILAGLEVIVRGPNAVQKIYIYTPLPGNYGVSYRTGEHRRIYFW